MSEDPDFEMEVVEDDELAELGGSSEPSSDEQDHLDMEETGKSKRGDSKNSAGTSEQESSAKHEERKSRPRHSHGGEEIDVQRFGPFTFDLPEDWRAERQGAVKRLFTRGRQPSYADDGVPVINQECIYWDGWHFENLRFLDREEAEGWPEKYFPKEGDIILNSTGQGTLGRAQVYPDEKRRAVDSHVTILRTSSGLNPHFHRYFLESHLGQALLYSMCVNGSTGQIELSKTRLDLMPVPIPPHPEQRKIASVLYAVDQAIQKTEEIIEQAKRVKRGLMQDIFRVGLDPSREPKKSRVGEIPKTWSVSTLEEIVSFKNGLNFSADQKGRGTPIVNVHDLYDSVTITPPELDRIEVDSSEVQKYALEPGDIVMVRSSVDAEGVGQAALFEGHSEPVVFAGFTIRQRPDRTVVSPNYLVQYLREPEVRKKVASLAGTTALTNLSQKEVGKLPVSLPPSEEQKKIAHLLGGWDEQVRKEEVRKKHFLRLKKGLMQDLLTGEVRTAEKAIEVLEEVQTHG